MSIKEIHSKQYTISASPQYSDSFSLYNGYAFALHWVYTSGAGSGILQYSNDNSNWVDVTGTSQSFSGSSSALWDVTQCGAAYVRLKFTSGTNMTGTLYFNWKG